MAGVDQSDVTRLATIVGLPVSEMVVVDRNHDVTTIFGLVERERGVAFFERDKNTGCHMISD
ncbi:hypothetical protein Ct61P_11692 [Colletotrichum tofieldiae]|nr:hypothetical protein Ct61P_11692 [Colletotrichum tofieldiae]